jgi:hypothetical protein
MVSLEPFSPCQERPTCITRLRVLSLALMDFSFFDILAILFPAVFSQSNVASGDGFLFNNLTPGVREWPVVSPSCMPPSKGRSLFLNLQVMSLRGVLGDIAVSSLAYFRTERAEIIGAGTVYANWEGMLTMESCQQETSWFVY